MDTKAELFPVTHHPALGVASLEWSDDHDERQWWHLHALSGPGVPGIRRPRVLLEMPSMPLAATVATVLQEEGYDVAQCCGPAQVPYGCPLTRGMRCPIADDADVIIDGLGLTTPDDRAVWAGHDATHADTPQVLVIAPGAPAIAVRQRPGRACILGPLTRQAILAAVEHVAGRAS